MENVEFAAAVVVASFATKLVAEERTQKNQQKESPQKGLQKTDQKIPKQVKERKLDE